MLPGSLIFVVQEIPNNLFRREKNDLHTFRKITLKEALLGFELQITHLDGRQVQIKKTTVTQSGDIYKVRGEGMPYHQSSERGDLFIRLDVIFPNVLNDKQLQSKNNLIIKLLNYCLINDLIGEKIKTNFI